MKTLAGIAVGFVLLLCGRPRRRAGRRRRRRRPAAPVSAHCATDANLATILATIRSVESGGDYTIESAGGSTASGAYQFLDSSWDGYGGYARAADAPPELSRPEGRRTGPQHPRRPRRRRHRRPRVWYIGHVPADGLQRVGHRPLPGAGNQLTPRQYQTNWLEEYTRQQATTPAGAPAAAARHRRRASPAARCPTTSTAATSPGAATATGTSPNRPCGTGPTPTFLHPAASESFDQLYAAAQRVGLDLRGNGYRPASAGGNTAGRSCHGLGLAVDITALTGDPDVAFASPEFTWLCANAETYGWITPRWALPAGMRCGTVTGTGVGGNRRQPVLLPRGLAHRSRRHRRHPPRLHAVNTVDSAHRPTR